MRTFYQEFKVTGDKADPNIIEAVQLIESIPGPQDVIVVVGGDGTMSKAIHELGPAHTFLGINYGMLGFLMNDVGREDGVDGVVRDLDALREFLVTQAWETYQFPRVRLTTNTGIEDVGLNDAYIERDGDATAHMKIVVDGVTIVERQSADGLIVASPTGSTAYNRSAGGSLMHPRFPGLIMTAICPHLPTLRPLVLPPQVEITVDIWQPEWRPVKVTVDGRSHRHEGDDFITKVRIRGASPAKLAFPPNHLFLQTMVRKDLLR